MEILKVIETLESCSEDVVAYKLGATFADAVSEAVSLLIGQGEKIADLENALAESRWIPVTERLPEEAQAIEFHYRYADDKIRTGFVDVIRYYTINGEPFWGYVSGTIVTHWRPITGPKGDT